MWGLDRNWNGSSGDAESKWILLNNPLDEVRAIVQQSWQVNESDPRSNVHYLGSSETKAWKKFRPVWWQNSSLFNEFLIETKLQ